LHFVADDHSVLVEFIIFISVRCQWFWNLFWGCKFWWQICKCSRYINFWSWWVK